MEYSLKQAAEATGKSKPTILRALQKGKISGEKGKNGQWLITPDELHRIYPVLPSNDTRTDTEKENEIALLRRELDILKQERRRDYEQIEDLRQDRDDWKRQATALLTDQRPKSQQTDTDGALTLWQWLGLAKR